MEEENNAIRKVGWLSVDSEDIAFASKHFVGNAIFSNT